jgi:hypothetical protein
MPSSTEIFEQKIAKAIRKNNKKEKNHELL